MTDLPFSDLLYTRLNWERDRARTIGDLAEDMNVSRRQIEKAVETLRQSGAPICSGSEGIWLTQSGVELMAQYRALRRRALHQLSNLRSLQRTARAMAGTRQETLWGDAA
jgi:biotin operon repressor